MLIYYVGFDMHICCACVCIYSVRDKDLIMDECHKSLCGRTTISGLLSFKRSHVNPFLGLSFRRDSSGATSHQYLLKCKKKQKKTHHRSLENTCSSIFRPVIWLALDFYFVSFTFHICERRQNEGEINTWLRVLSVTNQCPVFANKRRTNFSRFCRVHRKGREQPKFWA